MGPATTLQPPPKDMEGAVGARGAWGETPAGKVQ